MVATPTDEMIEILSTFKIAFSSYLNYDIIKWLTNTCSQIIIKPIYEGTGTVNSSFEVRNKLHSGKEISDKEICQFVVNLVMPLFAFVFNGEFKLKDISE